MDVVSADHPGGRALDNERGAFVDADAQELRVAAHESGHVAVALSLGEMLVDGDTRKKAEAAFVAVGHHVEISERAAAGHVLALDGGTGAGAADDAAAAQDVAK